MRFWPTLLALGTCSALFGQATPPDVSPVSAKKQPFDVQALMKIGRISEPQISPDGKLVAFTLQTIDLDRNTKPKQIYVVSTEGGSPRQITREGTANERPRWSPDSKRIAFISNRSGASQVWMMDADGLGARQITNLSTEASGVTFSPAGDTLLFLSDVYPDCADDGCNKRKLEEEKAAKSKARVYTSLLYRHWTEWEGARRKHLFIVPVEGGTAKDLTPGPRHVPPFSLGGPDDYSIAPDGKEVSFVMNPDADQALSTNAELFVTPSEGGEAKRITLNPAADKAPVYSPDGFYIAYLAQSRAGYESDRWRLVVLDRNTGRSTTLTDSLDRNVGSITWSRDSKRLFFTIDDRGRTSLQMIPVSGGASRILINGGGHIDDVQFSADGKTMIYTEQTGTSPTEIYKASSSGGVAKALTEWNKDLLEQVSLAPFEEVWVKSADESRVHSYVVNPPGFSPRRKYPVLFLIHGGPQGAWTKSWSYRWNPQVFAAAGFVVVMPNPRGSTGYGQKFTDDINADWGGKVYDDIMAVVDYVAGQPWADSGRFAAAGGSYGGYMVNWLLGHSDRFKAFVSHAGVFDLRSMAGETEELWFVKWEFKGMPWESPEVYEKWSPSNFINEFKTPTLVIHGELDYRVPVGQGLQLFTGLQMKKVPSKLLLFPDEGHWILKPQNSVLWYNSFLDWITEWTRKN
ncbi:MAG: S9 family peptidase [Bryobacteraceae bacterium]|nr:S9 family peptidase [Bryobacteraceae bacterium]